VGTQPAGLVSFGKRFRLRDETVRLTATPGPAITLRWGTVAVADPWWPEMLPESQVIAIARGEQPTLLSTVDMPRDATTERAPMSCAAVIGPVDDVVTWQPLVKDEEHFHLDSDSALGAFYDITVASALRPLFEDARHMQQVYNRALTERIVAMEIAGDVAAVVFLCPDGSGAYPAWAGFDRDMAAVAVLVDLNLLDDAE
jgi:hypothetical protein